MKLKEIFPAYLQHMKQMGMAGKTIQEHKRMLYGSLSHSISEREISSLKVSDAASVLEAGRNHGLFGEQRSIVVLRQLLKYMHDDGMVTPFDWRDLAVPHVRRKPVEYLAVDEMEAFLNSLDLATIAGLRERALLEILFASGMRIGEACALNKKDIDWDKREALITNIKTKDIEKVYFTERSLEWLKRYLDARKDDMPFLFVSGRGRLLPVSSRNYLREHVKQTGFPKRVYHHIMRKSFCTALLQNGATIEAVRDLARHKSARTTLDFYVAVNKERTKGIHEAIMGDAFNGTPKKPLPVLPSPSPVTLEEILGSTLR
jgi:site-specific recombinase XerD